MYYVLKAFSNLLGALSDAAAVRFARGLTVLAFDILRLRRQTVLDNLLIAFPTMPLAERIRIGRESVVNFTLTILEFFRASRVDIAAHIDIDGDEHLRSALAQGKGVYILCFHMGNWEAMGAKINRVYVPAHVLVKRVGSGSVNRFVEELRAKIGFLTVRREKKGDGYRSIKDILARGEIVGFVIDQARPGEPRLPFFGHPAKTNTSLAAIWRKVPAPVVPSWIERHALGHHTIHFFPEVPMTTTDDAERDIMTHSTAFNEVVASHVRRRPDLYFWMHNRWKE